MNKLVKNLIDTHSSALYGLNWQLSLNEEYATRMTEEVFGLFLQGNDTMAELSGQDSAQQFKLQLKLLQKAYELHVGSHVHPRQDSTGHWARLEPLQRSILFLKHKRDFSYHDMENIFQIPAAKLISLAHQSREFLLEGRSDLC